MTTITIKTHGATYSNRPLDLDVPHDADRETVYGAIQAHYETMYGADAIVRLEHLCTSPWDEEEQTVCHSATVEAMCQHGLSARTVVEVVLLKAA